MWINNKTEWQKMLYHQLPLVRNQALWLELPALSPPLENPVWSPLYRSTSSTSPSRALCWHLSRYRHTKTFYEAKTSFFNGVVAINCLACSSRAATMLNPCAGPITCCAAHSAGYRRCSLTLYKGAKCRKYLSEWVRERMYSQSSYIGGYLYSIAPPCLNVQKWWVKVSTISCFQCHLI